MGLIICQEIIRNCGGTIECFSEGENRGSTFSFSMKMNLVPQDTRIELDKEVILRSLQDEAWSSLDQIVDDIISEIPEKDNFVLKKDNFEISLDLARRVDLEELKSSPMNLEDGKS